MRKKHVESRFPRLYTAAVPTGPGYWLRIALVAVVVFPITLLFGIMAEALAQRTEPANVVTRIFQSGGRLKVAHQAEAVWRTQTTELWVNFKVFGLIALTVAFTLTQLPYMRRHTVPDEPAGG